MVTNWVHFVNSSYFIMIAINLVRRMESKTCQELAELAKLSTKSIQTQSISRFVKKIAVHCLNFQKLKLNFEIKLIF